MYAGCVVLGFRCCWLLYCMILCCVVNSVDCFSSCLKVVWFKVALSKVLACRTFCICVSVCVVVGIWYL